MGYRYIRGENYGEEFLHILSTSTHGLERKTLPFPSGPHARVLVVVLPVSKTILRISYTEDFLCCLQKVYVIIMKKSQSLRKIARNVLEAAY